MIKYYYSKIINCKNKIGYYKEYIWPRASHYYRNRLTHRDNGPAIISCNGSKLWFRNGELHRKNKPAIEYSNGNKEWWKNGEYVEQY